MARLTYPGNYPNELRPYPNEHACRLQDPGKFKAPWYRVTRKHEGKTYSVVRGTRKDNGKVEDQAFRYKKDTWAVGDARKHCKDHDGKQFEPAGESKSGAVLEFEERVSKRIQQFREEHPGLEDWLYLVHHIHADPVTGEETIHHCPLVDHLGNLYELGHVAGGDGLVRHYLVGLVEDQKVYWSEEEAEANGETVPCANRQLEG